MRMKSNVKPCGADSECSKTERNVLEAGKTRKGFMRKRLELDFEKRTPSCLMLRRWMRDITRLSTPRTPRVSPLGVNVSAGSLTGTDAPRQCRAVITREVVPVCGPGTHGNALSLCFLFSFAVNLKVL